jgi:hypothetical protein
VSSRASRRLNAGLVQATAGTRTAADSRQTRAPARFEAGKTAALLKYLARRGEAERDGIREHLRADGTPRALALLDELERRWRAPEPRDGGPG